MNKREPFLLVTVVGFNARVQGKLNFVGDFFFTNLDLVASKQIDKNNNRIITFLNIQQEKHNIKQNQCLTSVIQY
jgi:hypothetical protein